MVPFKITTRLPRKLSKLQKDILVKLLLREGTSKWPEGCLTFSKLKEYFANRVHVSSLSRTLRRLEKRGFITRAKGVRIIKEREYTRFEPIPREKGKSTFVLLTEMGIKVSALIITKP